MFMGILCSSVWREVTGTSNICLWASYVPLRLLDHPRFLCLDIGCTESSNMFIDIICSSVWTGGIGSSNMLMDIILQYVPLFRQRLLDPPICLWTPYVPLFEQGVYWILQYGYRHLRYSSVQGGVPDALIFLCIRGEWPTVHVINHQYFNNCWKV